MTPELEKVINGLKDKIQYFKGLHSNVLNENLELKERISSLLADIEIKDSENEQLIKKYESLKLAKTIAASAGDAHDAKVKLNRIVREIDRCISLLNK